jgi:hypothetical protein
MSAMPNKLLEKKIQVVYSSHMTHDNRLNSVMIFLILALHFGAAAEGGFY